MIKEIFFYFVLGIVIPATLVIYFISGYNNKNVEQAILIHGRFKIDSIIRICSGETIYRDIRVFDWRCFYHEVHRLEEEKYQLTTN